MKKDSFWGRAALLALYFVLLAVVFCGAVFLSFRLRSPSVGGTVLMYHSVFEGQLSAQAYLSATPEQFEEELKYLRDNGYGTLLVGERAGEKDVFITFDDGYVDNYTEVFPLLKKYNAKATVFMVSSYIGREGFLSAEQLREMAESGYFSIQSHTKSHAALTQLPSLLLEDEFRESREKIEAATGKAVFAVSFPYGYSNRYVRKEAAKYYDMGFITTFKGGAGLYECRRREIPRGLTIEQFADALNKN